MSFMCLNTHIMFKPVKTRTCTQITTGQKQEHEIIFLVAKSLLTALIDYYYYYYYYYLFQ